MGAIKEHYHDQIEQGMREITPALKGDYQTSSVLPKAPFRAGGDSANLDEMNAFQLWAIARVMNIKGLEAMTRDELIDAIWKEITTINE